ncbi:MAG: MFS transporter [Pseudomonadales bacterium]
MTALQRRLLFTITVSQGFAIGMTYGTFPLFLQPLEDTFDASRTVISSGQLIVMLAMSLGGLVVGSKLDKGYPRQIMMFGATLIICSLAAGSLANQLWVLAIVAFAIGCCFPAIGPLIGAGLVTRYFEADRGRALGLMSIGPPLGSGLFAALAGFCIPSIGWQGTMAMFAGLCTLLLPLIWWNVPARFPVATVADAKQAQVGSTMFDVLRRRVFLWTVFAYALLMGTTMAWTVHIAAFLSSIGMNALQQASVLALSFWMGIPGALIFGYLADRIKPSRLFACMITLSGFALILYTQSPAPSVVVGLVAVAGFAMGGAIPLYSMLLGERVGADEFGKAMGVSNLFILPVMGVAVLSSATLYERYANYNVALMLLVALLCAALLCLWISNRIR